MRYYGVLLLLSSTISFGFVKHGSSINPTLTEKVVTVSRSGQTVIKKDMLDGSTRFIQGALANAKSVSKLSLLKTAQSFVETNKSELGGLRFSDLKINEKALYISDAFSFIKFDVYRNDMLVKGAVVDFRFQKNKLVQVLNRSYAHIAPSGSMRSAAKKHFSNITQTHKKHYRIVEEGGRYLMLPVDVLSIDEQGEPMNVELYGDQIILKNSKYHFASKVTGPAYARTYYNEEPIYVGLEDINLNVNGRATVAGPQGSFEASIGDSVDFSGLISKGTYVSPGWWGTNVAFSGDVDGDIKLPVQEDAEVGGDQNISQVMAHYHVKKIRDLALKYLPKVSWINEQLTVYVNSWSFVMSCNAFWDGSTINFLIKTDDCANTGLIADVYYHEWGHGLDDNTGGIDDSAFSEGFGDILSMIMTQEPDLAKGFLLNGGSIRELETNRVYPDDTGEVHYEGLIIGSTFWDLMQDLKKKHGIRRGTDLVSKYAFLMIVAATKYLDVYDALLVIDDDDGDLSNRTPNYCILNKNFAAHGLADKDSSCE